MVWGAFCGDMKTPLHLIPPGTKVDSGHYTLRILDLLLIPFWHETCERYGWTQVVEDGAPGHKRFAAACRERNEMEILPWPPQSPDLNLIEALWGDMETELGETFGWVKDLNTLQTVLHAVWNSVEGAERLDGLIRSMPHRLAAVIAVDGMATPY